MQAQLPQLWLFDLRPFFEHDRWRALLPELSMARRRRALSCRREADAARLAGAGYLLQQALLSLDIPLPQQRFFETEWGKPQLASHAVEFSLTHAGFYAACALDAAPIGVDLESPRITMHVAGRCFHPDEMVFLRSISESAQKDALLRIWTAKEAYTKKLGRGLSLPLDSFCVDLSGKSPVLRKDGAPLPERLHEYVLDGFRLCLCAESARPNLTVFSPPL